MLKKKNYSREETDKDEFSIYSKDVRESLMEDDEISPFEEAFMEGYDRAI